jgi:hypothetical protein
MFSELRTGSILPEGAASYRIKAEKRRERLDGRYQIYEIVKAEIDKWNPYGLLPDAPHDEFNSESEDIARHLWYDSAVEKITGTISGVFSRAFEPENFTPEDCRGVADNIARHLRRNRKNEGESTIEK